MLCLKFLKYSLHINTQYVITILTLVGYSGPSHDLNCSVGSPNLASADQFLVLSETQRDEEKSPLKHERRARFFFTSLCGLLDVALMNVSYLI